jgi:hypothetical protein
MNMWKTEESSFQYLPFLNLLGIFPELDPCFKMGVNIEKRIFGKNLEKLGFRL